MIHVEYIIVGQGIAGTSFCARLIENKKTFIVIDNNYCYSSSIISGGILNPFILRYFTLVKDYEWHVNNLIHLIKFLEELLNNKYLLDINIVNLMYNNSQLQLFRKKYIKYKDFISDNKYKYFEKYGINNKYGFANIIYNSARIEIRKLLIDFKNYLILKNNYILDDFKYDKLNITKDHIIYKNLCAKKIVFTEGYNLIRNPFFKYISNKITGSNGSSLIIDIDKYIPPFIFKSKDFLIPINNDIGRCMIGFNNYKNSNNIDSKNIFINNLFTHILNKSNISFVSYNTRIRPCITDTNPIIGNHIFHKNIFILNGLGYRGILMSGSLSLILFDYINNNKPIQKIYNINRFYI